MNGHDDKGIEAYGQREFDEQEDDDETWWELAAAEPPAQYALLVLGPAAPGMAETERCLIIDLDEFRRTLTTVRELQRLVQGLDPPDGISRDAQYGSVIQYRHTGCIVAFGRAGVRRYLNDYPDAARQVAGRMTGDGQPAVGLPDGRPGNDGEDASVTPFTAPPVDALQGWYCGDGTDDPFEAPAAVREAGPTIQIAGEAVVWIHERDGRRVSLNGLLEEPPGTRVA